MAFDFYNIQKPGKGVEKREYTPRFALFWELLSRKAWLMVKANIVYLLTSILALVFIWFGFTVIARGEYATLKGAVFLTAATLYLSVIGIGFIMPGLTFLSRYFARQRHVWVFSDFFEQIVTNFKKGCILFLVDSLIIYLSTVAFTLYGELALNNTVMLIPLGFMAICLLIYFMMHFYMYPIMVTFDLDMKYILKDSLLLTLAHLPLNLFITVIISVIPFAVYVVNIPIGLILFGIIGVALMNFIINYMVDPIIDKHLYIPAEVIAENEASENE